MIPVKVYAVCDTGSRKTVIPEKKPSSDWECTLCQV